MFMFPNIDESIKYVDKKVFSNGMVVSKIHTERKKPWARLLVFTKVHNLENCTGFTEILASWNVGNYKSDF